MPLTVRQIGIAVAATVILGSVFWQPTSAYAARSYNRLGSSSWDLGGGDFRWTYGSSIAWYYEPHDDCVLRRRIYVNRRGHRSWRWVHICY
jgi:hypothetical protein